MVPLLHPDFHSDCAPAPRLLVSVRSAPEAIEALVGGASIIDVKEPSRGSLGPAEPATWQAVRAVVPPSLPVSVALGELADWLDGLLPVSRPDAHHWRGVHYRKLGMSRMRGRRNWDGLWSSVRRSFEAGPFWVAVVYLDHEIAHAPEPEEVISVVARCPELAGVLFDTWNKRVRLEENALARLTEWIDRVRSLRRFVALAGSLEASTIRESLRLGPDFFAVRGAACLGGLREGDVDRHCVRRLVEALGGRARPDTESASGISADLTV